MAAVAQVPGNTGRSQELPTSPPLEAIWPLSCLCYRRQEGECKDIADTPTITPEGSEGQETRVILALLSMWDI